jgi:methyltransferase family protein
MLSSPETLAPSTAARMREFLSELGYTRSRIREILIDNELPSATRRNLPLLLDRSQPRDPLRTLIRLFLVGGTLEASVVGEQLPGWLIEACLELGLLASHGSDLQPQVMLVPFNDLLLATDPAQDIIGNASSDTVLGINPTTWMLYHATMRRQAGSVLDLGAGCGVHALCAASHPGHVVATDLNPRATAFAAFNARLNGCDNVECLTGDTFEPVRGRRFDLIVTNPPFFISPSTRNLFCDNKGILDGYCRELIRQAPDHLEDGGCLQLVCEWAHVRGEPWQERLTGWFEGTGCDAWVLRIASHEPGRYAQERIRETTPSEPGADESNFNAWMRYYAEHQVEAIHAGVLTLRRRSGRNWVKVEDLPPGISEPFGHSIERGLTNLNHVTMDSDDELLTTRFRVAAEARLDQRIGFADGQWRSASFNLRMTDGIPFETQLEAPVADFIGRLGEAGTLGSAIEALAERISASPDSVRRECVAIVRRLLQHGYLEVRG